ncbi:MAG: hypothetical protein LBH11_01965 [Propionibacteriaceae bacterium]|jgi:hypothetical protein|nr:hypothetical protein [Propionibacteriaceae bacterium]
MPAPEYTAARRVLLDALEALHDHLDNLILVGAQAVYLHTGEGTLNVPPMTTDADLALNTQRLTGSPEIARTLIDAGFTPSTNPGHWLGAQGVAIDIMVVPHQAGTTSKTARGARIPPHAKNVGRIAPGLEPALIDNAIHTIASFEDGDPRTLQLRVANPAALLVAKAVKVSEREDGARHQPGRLKAKDALDMFRLLQAIETEVLVEGLRGHQSEPEAACVSMQGITFIKSEGTAPDGLLPTLATETAFGDPTIAPAFAALARALVDALG